MFNAFSVAVYGMTGIGIVAIADPVSEADRIGNLGVSGLLALGLLGLAATVVYLHKRGEAKAAAQLSATQKNAEDILAHHNSTVVKMNEERAEYRNTLTGLIQKNTEAFVRFTDTLENMKSR